jgi:hypothetical protein
VPGKFGHGTRHGRLIRNKNGGAHHPNQNNNLHVKQAPQSDVRDQGRQNFITAE